MKIAFTYQNQTEITGHAGKTSRFLIYTVNPTNGEVLEKEIINLQKEDILHIRFHESDNPWAPHPIFDVDLVITGGAGTGFVNKLASQSVKVLITTEKNPDKAIDLLFKDQLPIAMPHSHHHHN